MMVPVLHSNPNLCKFTKNIDKVFHKMKEIYKVKGKLPNPFALREF